ncbi:hypothetical protein BC829DRAFT_448404 [Chytridium lagenaria]|nr:hypothetical protein BC829DRAFT_448404 [Chytridium lagenaria]
MNRKASFIGLPTAESVSVTVTLQHDGSISITSNLDNIDIGQLSENFPRHVVTRLHTAVDEYLFNHHKNHRAPGTAVVHNCDNLCGNGVARLGESVQVVPSLVLAESCARDLKEDGFAAANVVQYHRTGESSPPNDGDIPDKDPKRLQKKPLLNCIHAVMLYNPVPSTPLGEELGSIRFLQLNIILPITHFPIPRFRIFLIAESDANHELVSTGEDAMKRSLKPDLKNDEVVLDLKTLTWLSRSMEATNRMQELLQTAFHALKGQNSTLKLRSAGTAFAQWVARMGKSEKRKPVAENILSGLLIFIDETSARKREHPRILIQAFGLMSDKRNRRTPIVFVQEAFSSIVEAFRDAITRYDLKTKIEEEFMGLTREEMAFEKYRTKLSNFG